MREAVFFFSVWLEESNYCPNVFCVAESHFPGHLAKKSRLLLRHFWSVCSLYAFMHSKLNKNVYPLSKNGLSLEKCFLSFMVNI